MMKLLILNNYDSFTYNLVHLVEKHSAIPFEVHNNDTITVEEACRYQKILLSPGPGLPSEAGIMPQLLKAVNTSVPILGVCLGMQAMGEASGAALKNLDDVFHGVATDIVVDPSERLFKNCPRRFKAGRYHSWVIDEARMSSDLIVTARDNHNLIMAIRHQRYNWCGVQFHPESILSEYGDQIISNWLQTE